MDNNRTRFKVNIGTQKDAEKLYSLCKTLIRPEYIIRYTCRITETTDKFTEGEEFPGIEFVTDKKDFTKLLLKFYLHKILWYEEINLKEEYDRFIEWVDTFGANAGLCIRR